MYYGLNGIWDKANANLVWNMEIESTGGEAASPYLNYL